MADRQAACRAASRSSPARAAGSARRPREALAAAGAHVVLTARDAKALEAVEERIHAAGGTATIAPMDLTETDAIARLAAAIAERWDALDILVINAAMLPQLTPVTQIEPEQLQPGADAQRAGHAGAARRVRSAAQAQRATAAVIGLTSTRRRPARAPTGAPMARARRRSKCCSTATRRKSRNISKIRVAIVDPGATRTAMRARAYPGEDPASVKPPEAVAERLVALLGEQFASRHRENRVNHRVNRCANACETRLAP